MSYDHYIALDWAQRNMAVGRMTKNSEYPKITEAKSDIEELKIYLRSLKGSKILTFEESNPAHWLFTELKSEVDEIIVCDPYRNYLLKEGHKSDPIDAGKLCILLKGNLLKPVFHCTDEFINLRKLVSGYEDLIHAVVQLKNRISAMYRAKGLAFHEMRVPKLFAGHNPKNSASKAMLEKLGFKFVGEQFYQPTGLLHPSYELEATAQTR